MCRFGTHYEEPLSFVRIHQRMRVHEVHVRYTYRTCELSVCVVCVCRGFLCDCKKQSKQKEKCLLVTPAACK